MATQFLKDNWQTVLIGVFVVAALVALIVCLCNNKSPFESMNGSPGITKFLQQDLSAMDFPITNRSGYRNPTVGLPVQPISTPGDIKNDILAPSRAKSVIRPVQEVVIYRGPGDQPAMLPLTTTGAVMQNERALQNVHNIAGIA
jgi:hypothetical protein